MAIDPLAVIAYRREHYRIECLALGAAVVMRLREGSLPADDAYAWGRIMGELGRKALTSPDCRPIAEYPTT